MWILKPEPGLHERLVQVNDAAANEAKAALIHVNTQAEELENLVSIRRWLGGCVCDISVARATAALHPHPQRGVRLAQACVPLKHPTRCTLGEANRNRRGLPCELISEVCDMESNLIHSRSSAKRAASLSRSLVQGGSHTS